MIARAFRLTLVRPDGSIAQDSVSRAELDRRVMTPLIDSWVAASPDELEILMMVWNGAPSPAYARSVPSPAEANFNPVATKAHDDFLRTPEGAAVWSPDDGRVYGPVVIIEDLGLIKRAPPARSSDELASHDWFGLAQQDGGSGRP